jgi:hypothetical protein
MSKILNKWYFSLILIPIIINLVTADFALTDFYENWKITVIGILVITCLILSFEQLQLKKTIKVLISNPNERDKRVVKELIEIIDIPDFEESVYKQNSWYGYSQRAIHKTMEFSKKALSEESKTSDEKLNKLIKILADTLYDFNAYAGVKLYSEGNSYNPAKENEYNIKITEEATPIMNEMTTKAYLELQKLMKYLRSHNYLS